MRIAFDSNILIYLSGGERVEADRRKIRETQRSIVVLARRAEIIAPVQSMGEALRVLIYKLGKTPSEISVAMESWEDSFEAVQTTVHILREAVALAAMHRLQHWDAIIIAASVAGGCEILLSEDMQHGFIWRGLTIINPFVVPQHHLLASLLEP